MASGSNVPPNYKGCLNETAQFGDRKFSVFFFIHFFGFLDRKMKDRKFKKIILTKKKR